MKSLLMALTLVTLVACNVSKEQLKATLKENPDILVEAMKENPTAFMDGFQETVEAYKKEMQMKEMSAQFENPFKPVINASLVRGDMSAPITLVEYSDFQCPYCSRAFKTVEDMRAKYGDKIKFAYKHLVPGEDSRGYHPQARDAARYFEALKLQDSEKAWKFHDELLRNIRKVSLGVKYFESVAKEVGANLKKLKTDVKSEAVEKRLLEDTMEASKFGFRGTPGFLVNGIPVRGYVEAGELVKIVEELQKKGKLKI